MPDEAPATLGAAVEITGLRVEYGDVLAVDDLNLTAPVGLITAVLGPNGAGKTSTLEVCEGLRRASAGSVRVLGLDPATSGSQVRPRVGVMLQDGGLHPGATARELLQHGASLHAHPHDPRDLAELLGLDSLGRRVVRRMSGGEQRRLAFALAIIGRPELLFLDEPTAGLDPQARLAVWDIVAQLRASGVSIILTTHLIEEVEKVADRVVVIDHGTTVVTGTLQQILSDHGGDQLIIRTQPGLPLDGLRSLLSPGTTISESTPGRYVARGPITSDAANAAQRWGEQLGISLNEVGIKSVGLEDVFLDLTGRELRP